MAVLTTRGKDEATVEVLADVVSGGRRFVFAQPLEVEVTHPDSTWVLWHHSTGMNSFGLSYEEAAEAFAEDVAFCWDVYAQQADDKLGKSAIPLKYKLLDLIAEVRLA